jgi:YidC/Oxa1 family membrane protein insertase
MKKSNEMMALYKKEGINPVGGCVMALIQLPLFIAFFEAINRIPAIFEGKLLGFQLGTVPWTAIQNGQYHYIILTLLIVAASYFSFNFTKQDTPQAGGLGNQKFMTIFFVGFIGFASLFTFPVAIGFYWITSTSFTIVQNLLVKRGSKK